MAKKAATEGEVTKEPVVPLTPEERIAEALKKRIRKSILMLKKCDGGSSYAIAADANSEKGDLTKALSSLQAGWKTVSDRALSYQAEAAQDIANLS